MTQVAIRKPCARIAICTALLCLPVAAQSPQLKEYSYPADGFAVSFPSMPLVQTKTVPAETGSIELHEYSEQIDGASLLVTVSNYGASMGGKDVDTQLKGAKNGALKNADARLKSEKPLTLDGNHGLEFEADGNATHFTVRMYMVGTSLYQLLVAAPVEKPYEATSGFLDSFKLIPKPGN
jgi:hypothetical protein